MRRSWACVVPWLLGGALAVQVKVIMHSEQEDSRPDEDATLLPFLRTRRHDYEDDKPATEPLARQLHPNEIIFPLIYKQNHINSMFKFAENWYTWSTETRTDGSKATNYYICYDEPKHCDDIGWERTGTLPKCAFQVESLVAEDRACVNSFGVEPRPGAPCDGAHQMKVSEMVRACGARIRSLWRFFRVARRAAAASKPADVNSLLCEDEDECYISLEYRIHHDRITFSIHEPTRGQTFKSALKRELGEEEAKATATTEGHRRKKVKVAHDEEPHAARGHAKGGARGRTRAAEGKGPLKEHDDSAFANRKLIKSKIKIREDISDDISE